MLFDTHAHLADEQLAAEAETVVARAQAAGVAEILSVGTDLASSRACVALAQRLAGVYASAGLHPNHVAGAQPGEWEAIVALAHAGGVVALGETGLDRHWNDTPFDQQRESFAQHWELSHQTGLPVIVHMRDCADDIVAALAAAAQRFGVLRGVMHSFTGDAALAETCLQFGLHISFAGMVTFKKSADLRSVAARIPADRLLLETDSPYLSPEPHRGRRPNEPARLVHTAECLAQVRGTSLEELARQTTANARRWLRLEG